MLRRRAILFRRVCIVMILRWSGVAAAIARSAPRPDGRSCAVFRLFVTNQGNEASWQRQPGARPMGERTDARHISPIEGYLIEKRKRKHKHKHKRNEYRIQGEQLGMESCSVTQSQA